MRIRSIKPEFWKSDDTASLKDWADRLVFVGLWSYVDDNGVGRDNDKLITAELFPLDDDPLESSARVRRALANLSERRMITRYRGSDGREFLHVTNWHHQKIDKPTRSPYPLPTCEDVTFVEDSPNPPRILPEDSAPGSRDLGIEGSRDRGIEQPPSAEPKVPYSIVFERFWKLYPRKVGKDAAWKQWEKARKRVDPALIVAGVERLAADPNLPTDAQFIPHPATWLSRGSWDDEPYPEPQKPAQRYYGKPGERRSMY